MHEMSSSFGIDGKQREACPKWSGDCGGNSKTDAENICECDKRFAENIAETREKCDAGEPADSMYGEHCMDHSQFKTTNAGGSFVPQDQCDKQFHGHDKNRCCGIYPNRYPYDDNHKEH